VRYLNDLVAATERAISIGIEPKGLKDTVRNLSGLIDELTTTTAKLVEQNAELGGDDLHSKAHHMRDNIVPAMAAVRAVTDRLEKVVPDDLWPLPTYREMLFVK
jgi:glutamine synthetase